MRAPKTTQINRTRNTVLDAVIALLSEVGYRQLTVELISQRTGVARSTIYRHWRSVPEMAIEAFDRALGPNPPVPDTGNVREDLLTSYLGLSKILKRSIWGKALPSLIEATHNDPSFEGLLVRLTKQRRKNTRVILRRAIDRGEIKPETNTDWVLDSLSGLLYHRMLVTGGGLQNPAMIEWAVDSALSQIRA